MNETFLMLQFLTLGYFCQFKITFASKNVQLTFCNNNVVMFVFEELHFVFKYELGNQAQDVIENRMD